MHSHCPKCNALLAPFAVECERCHWKIAGFEGAFQSSQDEQPVEVDLYLERAISEINDERYKEAIIDLNRAIATATPDRLAECHALRGYAALKMGEYERAVQECSRSLELSDDDAETLAWRAAALGELDRWRDAFADLSHACQLSAEFPDPYLNLIRRYLRVATEYYAARIAAGEDSADLYSDRGWVHLYANDYARSQRDFKLAIERDPNHAWAALGLARNLYEAERKHDGAHDQEELLCQKAMDRGGAAAWDALHLRAIIRHGSGSIAKADKDLRELHRLAGDDPGKRIELGDLQRLLGNPIAAISSYTRAVRQNPDASRAYRKRGECYAELQNFPLAIEDATRFLRVQPRHAPTRILRGQACLATDQLEKAMHDFERVLEEDPRHFEARLGRSSVFRKWEQLDEALSECQLAVSQNNTSPAGFATLGEIYMQLCDYGRAIEEFDRAAQRATSDSQRAEFLYRKGNALFELKQYQSALEAFQEATQLRPGHAGVWVWKAACNAHLENWTQSIRDLQHAIALRPGIADNYHEIGKPVAERAIKYFNRQQQQRGGQPELFRQRGLACQFLSQTEAAIRDFTAALNLEPDHAETRIRRGQAFAALGDHESAIEDFRTVIRANRQNHLARYWRAGSWIALGRIDRALSDIVKAIRESARIPAYHLLHGDLLWRRGKADKAIKAFNRAIRLDASDPRIYRRRAGVHAHRGEMVEAIRDYTRALEIRPGTPDDLTHRGQLLLKIGRISDAKRDFETALKRDDKIVRAYTGRARALAAENRHEEALIWLTKAIHRFVAPRDLSELMFNRGKIFFQMNRPEPAIDDFSSVTELSRSDPGPLLAARYARGIARVALELIAEAAADFDAVLALEPNHSGALAARNWILDRSLPRPAFLETPDHTVRVARPPVVGAEVELAADQPQRWEVGRPYHTWLLRTMERKEYGPVPKSILDQWVAEGRIVAGMKLLRADWGKWKQAEKIYPILDSKQVEVFPALRVDTDQTQEQ